MGKPTICIGKNKGADQLRSNCEADQCLCFRYKDGTIPLLSKSNISSLKFSSVTVQPSLCRTWSEPKLLVFSSTGSNLIADNESSFSIHNRYTAPAVVPRPRALHCAPQSTPDDLTHQDCQLCYLV